MKIAATKANQKNIPRQYGASGIVTSVTAAQTPTSASVTIENVRRSRMTDAVTAGAGASSLSRTTFTGSPATPLIVT